MVPIRFKNTPEWRTAVDDAKAVLATRENLPTGPERQAARRAPRHARTRAVARCCVTRFEFRASPDKCSFSTI